MVSGQSMGIVGLLIATAVAGALLSGQEAPQQERSDQQLAQRSEATIVVEVSRVPLLFTVTDKKNRFITDLGKDDFRVFDNGERQGIMEFVRETELPLRIGIVMDTSNSVRDRFRFEQEAAIAFIRDVLQEEKDRVFLVSYDTRAELVVDFTNDADKLAEGVRRLRPGGGTALYDAIYYSCRDKLPEDQPLEQYRRALIVLGDGDDNQSAVTRDMALEMAHRAEAVVYTISTNRTGSRQSGDKVLRFFATETGGVTFNPFQAEELSQSFTDIANELRHQYFIMYSPQPFAADGSFHRVEVKCNVKNADVRVRSGYYAPAPGT
jgi:VWFA-related protein